MDRSVAKESPISFICSSDIARGIGKVCVLLSREFGI